MIAAWLLILIITAGGQTVETVKRDRDFPLGAACATSGAYYAKHLSGAARQAGFDVKVGYRCTVQR